jgi:hypothetical protein
MKPAKPDSAWRNRIVGSGTEAPDQLLANPHNFRRHPTHQQRALEGSLSEIGWVQQVVVNRTTSHIVDGHLRVEMALRSGEAEIPVLYVELSEAEEQIALLSLDPIAALATQDSAQLAALIADAKPNDQRLQEFLADLLPADQGGQADQARVTLAERFIVPPFSILDARTGRWQDRKRAWIGLGIRSELGRGSNGDNTAGGGLTFALGAQTPATYDRKREAERRAGQPMTWADFAAAPPEAMTLALDSVFDPVLTEIAYRWFCPPGGSILDPFAGGSVRGIVAAMSGYSYTGIDLRAEQVDANRTNWTAVAAGGSASAPAQATPPLLVEEIDGFRVVRDDRVEGGTKRRALARILPTLPADEIVYASPAYGFAQFALALAAADVGKRVTIFVAKRKDWHPRTRAASAAGATIVDVPNGYLSNVQSKAREYAAEHGAHYIEFGADDPALIGALADIARETGESPTEVWTVAGSGVLSRALQQAWPTAKFHAVQIGAVPDAGSATVWKAPEKFEQPAKSPPPFPSCPEYDAKAWAFMQKHASPGALFWNVASDLHGETQAVDTQAPTWITGDSTDLETLLPPGEQFDFVFTCPPYYDLEVYSDDPRDISAAGSYDEFMDAYRQITAATAARLKPDRFAAVVIGEIRGPDGAYRNLVADTIDAHLQAGLTYYNEAILITPVGSLPIRAGRVFKASRKVGKTHQQMLVFRKGHPPAAEAADAGAMAGAIAAEFAANGALQDQHAKVLVFVKGDPREATAAAGPAAIDDEATE